MGRTEPPLRTTVAVAALAVMAGCSGGGGPSATQVAVRWRSAIEKGDYATAWDLEGPNLRAPAGKTVEVKTRNEDRFGQPQSPGAAAVTIKALQTAPDGDHPGETKVYLQVQTKDQARNHDEAVGLAKISGAWRVQRREPFVSPPGQQ